MNLKDLVYKNRLSVLLMVVSLAIILVTTYLNRLAKPPISSVQKQAVNPQLITHLTPLDGRPPIFLGKDLKNIASFSAYLKTAVGKTRGSEVAKLNNLKQRKILADKSVEYAFSSPLVKADNLVVTKDDVVVFKRVITTTAAWDHPAISTYISQYGNPEAEFTGSAHYGRFVKTYLYHSQGFAILGNPISDEVYELQSFLPMSKDQYLKEWGQDITSFKQQSEPQI